MPDTHVLAERPSQDQLAVYDAIVIGAGISGMYMLYRLRELGMTARVFETGTNAGGTWYWNRYPGARFDSESWTYGYSFSKELMREWDWREHFSPQPDTLEYLNYVADKFDLRRDIQFRSTVAAAHWDEAANQWNVALESGQQANSRFLFTAIGILSAYTLPAIPGRDSFKGPAYQFQAGLLRFMQQHDYTRVETRPEKVDEWTRIVIKAGEALLSFKVDFLAERRQSQRRGPDCAPRSGL